MRRLLMQTRRRLWSATWYAKCEVVDSCELRQVGRSMSSFWRSVSTEALPVKRPSVTWGVIQDYKVQSSARQGVLDFLKAEGIDTREFQSVELPTSIEVVKERLNFLKKIGLEQQHINEYPLVVCCSVQKNMVPVIHYLEKLGFTSKILPFFLRKYPMVLHTSVAVDLQPVVWYLDGFGIEGKDVPKMLLRYPDVLGFRLEGTISTSVAYLVSIGVGIREIAPMLIEFPQILGMRVGNNIKPKVEYLSSLGLPKEAVAKMLEKHPHLLGLGLDEKIKPAIASLISTGVREQALPAVVVQFPDIFTVNVEKKVAGKLAWLTKHIHISQQDFARIIEKMPQIIKINEPMAMDRIHFLRKGGCLKDNQIAKMVTSCPQILALSIKDVLSPNLMFFTREMKRPLQELVDFPAFFTYNLENRIQPRYKLVQQKGINCSLCWFLNCSDLKFQERLCAGHVGTSLAEMDLSFVMGGPFQNKDQSIHQQIKQPKVTSDEILTVGTNSIIRDADEVGYGATEDDEWSGSDEAGEEVI